MRTKSSVTAQHLKIIADGILNFKTSELQKFPETHTKTWNDVSRKGTKFPTKKRRFRRARTGEKEVV